MSRSTYAQWSFNAGELSPRVLGRTDLAIYQNAVKTMEGWLPLLQGPAIVAPGTVYVEQARGPCRLFPFEFNPTQGYVIEGSSYAFRFFTNNARIETAPGVAFEVAHNYTITDLQSIDYFQSEDVVYFAGGGQKPKKLTRTSAVTFEMADFEMRNGPLEVGNSDETITIHTDAWNIGVTVFASAPIFAPTDATNGRLLELESADFNDIRSWEPGMGVILGTLLRWGGRVYEVTDTATGVEAGRTGSNPPEHDEGEEWDGAGGFDVNDNGPYGVKLLFLYSRFGLLQIVGYHDPQTVDGHVLNPNHLIPQNLVTTPTWRWALGVFSDTTGWPDTIGMWNDCLVATMGNRVFTSVVGEFDNFGRRDSAGDFQRDLGGSFTLPQPAKINWQAADRKLLLGSDTGEWAVERLQIQTGTAGPPVFDIQLQSSNGSRKVKPIQADGRLLFLQRAGRKLRELGYAISSDRYVAPDMTRLADHIGISGIIDLAWMAEPERLAWIVLGDGTLASMTYDPEQQVMGWSRRPLGGGLKATSACRITDPEGKRDQIWLSVDAGANVYRVLRMAKIWEQGDDQQADQFIVDAGLSYFGAPAQTFSDLDHLEGQIVDILADGKVHRQLHVAAGAVTLDYAASKVHIGLPYPSLLEFLAPEAGQREGVARGKKQRTIAVNLQLLESQGLRVGVNGLPPVNIETRDANVPMDQAVPLYSGLHPVPLIGSYQTENLIRVERYQPTVSTLLAAIPVVDVGES